MFLRLDPAASGRRRSFIAPTRSSSRCPSASCTAASSRSERRAAAARAEDLHGHHSPDHRGPDRRRRCDRRDLGAWRQARRRVPVRRRRGRVSPGEEVARLPRARTARAAQRRDGVLEVRRCCPRPTASDACVATFATPSSLAVSSRASRPSPNFVPSQSSVTGRPAASRPAHRKPVTSNPRPAIHSARWCPPCAGCRRTRRRRLLGTSTRAPDAVTERQRCQRAADRAVGVDGAGNGVDHPAVRRHHVAVDADGPFTRRGERRRRHHLRRSEQRDQWIDARRRWRVGRRIRWNRQRHDVLRLLIAATSFFRTRPISARRSTVAQLHARADPRNRSRHRAWPHPDRRQRRQPDVEHHVPVVLRDRHADAASIGPDDLAGLNFIYPSGYPVVHLLDQSDVGQCRGRCRQRIGDRHDAGGLQLDCRRATPRSSLSAQAAPAAALAPSATTSPPMRRRRRAPAR